jgi:hypothetical protein
MKEKTKQFYQAVLDYLSVHPIQARILISALSLGFIFVSIGVMINLAHAENLFKIIIKLLGVE